ncbi:MAG: Cys-tRNA(Pro) deacylase [Clostridia bacterium]|nr:Cys-tRNA(Pro) deacylase [Clostridia bacterium]
MAKKDKNEIEKTNVMRILDAAKVPYTAHSYANTDAIAGKDVASVMGEDPDCVFKTLVTVAKSGEHYVFVIPVTGELDLKKAAAAVGEKAISMLKAKDLLPLTGYVHGGCSPVGMKKFFRTTFDETAILFDTIFFSAGKIGYQIEMNIDDLGKVIEFGTADLTV